LAIKKNFYVISGYEKNYLTQFNSLSQFANKPYGRTAAWWGLKKSIVFLPAPREYATALGFPKLPSNAQNQPILFRIGITFKFAVALCIIFLLYPRGYLKEFCPTYY